MLKLLIILVVAVAISLCTVQLRQQHLELSHQCNQLHDTIERRQARLWEQQLQIAANTTPAVIQQRVDALHIQLQSLAPRGPAGTSWIDLPGRRPQ